MMGFHDDPRWSAYMDGEMSASESASFDSGLSPNERERLLAEMDFESELGEVLGVPVECPREAWSEAMARVRHHDLSHASIGERMWRYALRLAPVAGIAALLLLGFFFVAPEPEPAFLSLNEKDVASFETKNAECDSVAEVRDFLSRRAVQVSLDPYNSLNESSTPYELVGACENDYRGELVMELLFRCSDGPAKVVIVRKAGSAAGEIGRALAAGTVRASRTVGDVIIAVVGQGAPRDLDRIVDDPNAHSESSTNDGESDKDRVQSDGTADDGGERKQKRSPFRSDAPQSLV